MVPRLTPKFSEAAKYFIGPGCTREEVEETAKAVGGQVVSYGYGRVEDNKSPEAPVKKMTLG